MAVIHGTNIENNAVPSLDLRFADRKNLIDTISGSNLITFSRSSSGTYVDAAGVIQSAATNVARFDHNPSTLESLGLLVEEARTNSLTYSQSFSIEPWTLTGGTLIPNSTTAPDSTATAFTLREDSSNGSHQVNYIITQALNNTFSIYAKPESGSRTLFINNGGRQSAFTLSGSGSVVTEGGSGTTGSASITQLSNGWYRCAVTLSGGAVQTNQVIVGLSQSTAITFGNFYTGDNTSGIFIWGAQLETGSFPTSYIPTPATFTGRTSTATYYDSAGVIQTAGSGVARSNTYFPDSNGVMRSAGLLLEAAATNLLTYSQEFDNAAWAKSNASITANAIAAPDGTTTADKLYEDSTNNPHYINSGYTFANGTQYTYSVFVKAAERTRIQLWVPPLSYFTFNTAAPSGNYQLLANGWYRVWTTFTGTGATYQVQLGLNDGVSNSYQGNGTSGIYIWGAQLETGSYPTSYIPTVATTVTRSADTSTSATVTRSADVAQITGANFSGWYNQSASTFMLSHVSRSGDYGKLIRFGSLNTTALGRLSGQYALADASNWYTSGLTAAAAPTVNRAAFSFSSAGYSLSSLGSSVYTTTNTPSSAGNASELTIFTGVGSEHSTGTIARLAYYPTRLQDATLQKLTR